MVYLSSRQCSIYKNISRILFIYARIEFSESISGPAFICCLFLFFNCISSFGSFVCCFGFGIILFGIYFCLWGKLERQVILSDAICKHCISCRALRARKIFRHKRLLRNRFDRSPQQLNIWFSGNVTPCATVSPIISFK